jgi:hypothetical protein
VDEKDRVSVELSRDEMVVLHAWISRFNESEQVFGDQAEARVLWDLEATLEKVNDVAFAADYAELLARARDAVRDQEEKPGPYISPSSS